MADGPPVTAAGICHEFLTGLPFTGAAFTVMTGDAVREIVYASDETIAAVARLQYSLGNGPALTAFTTGRPVVIPDLHAPGPAEQWPIFVHEAAPLPIGGLFTFPMRLGAITLGVCETYRTEPGPLTSPQLTLALGAVTLAATSLPAVDELAVYLTTDPEDDTWPDGHHHAALLVSLATGMLSERHGVTLTDALGLLRAHAWLTGHSIDETAHEIVEHHHHHLDTRPK